MPPEPATITATAAAPGKPVSTDGGPMIHDRAEEALPAHGGTQVGATLTNIAGTIQWFNGNNSVTTRTTYNRTLTDGTPTIVDYQDAHTVTVTFLNDIILEDASPSEGLQAMLNSGALTHFTMNDEEILLRHLHKVVGDYVEAGEKAHLISETGR